MTEMLTKADFLEKVFDYENNKESRLAHQKEYRATPSVVKRHNAYCMRPEYVKNKRIWDVAYRNMKIYGEFWESAILVNQIEIEVRKRVPKNERIYYRKCVKANTTRNNKRRLEKAINQILNGEADKRILSRPWIDESKQLLETLFIK